LLGLLGRQGLALFAGLSQGFAMLSVGFRMSLVAVRLPGLGQEDQRGRIGRLQAESQIEQDEGIEVKFKDPGNVQTDSKPDNAGLSD